MKLGTRVFELQLLAVDLLAKDLVDALLSSTTLNPTEAMMVAAARALPELPTLEGPDGSSEPLGYLVAEKLLGDQRLEIAATETGLELRLGEHRVTERTLRTLLDFGTFAGIHQEWFAENDGDEVTYPIAAPAEVVLTGSAEHWIRYRMSDPE